MNTKPNPRCEIRGGGTPSAVLAEHSSAEPSPSDHHVVTDALVCPAEHNSAERPLTKPPHPIPDCRSAAPGETPILHRLLYERLLPNHRTVTAALDACPRSIRHYLQLVQSLWRRNSLFRRILRVTPLEPKILTAPKIYLACFLDFAGKKGEGVPDTKW